MKPIETMKIESEDKSVYVALYEMTIGAIICMEDVESIVKSYDDCIFEFLEFANETVKKHPDMNFTFTTTYETKEVKGWFNERMEQGRELVGSKLATVIGMNKRYQIRKLEYEVGTDSAAHPRIKCIGDVVYETHSKKMVFNRFDSTKHGREYLDEGLCVFDNITEEIIDEWNFYREKISTERIGRK